MLKKTCGINEATYPYIKRSKQQKNGAKMVTQEFTLDTQYGKIQVYICDFDQVRVDTTCGKTHLDFSVGKTECNLYLRLKKQTKEDWAISDSSSHKRYDNSSYAKLPDTINAKMCIEITKVINAFAKTKEAKEAIYLCGEDNRAYNIKRKKAEVEDQKAKLLELQNELDYQEEQFKQYDVLFEKTML